jgi:plastocyanin
VDTRSRSIRGAVAVLVAALGLAVGLSACGDDDSDSEGTKTPVNLSGSVENKGTKDLTGQSNAEVEMEADDFYFEPTFLKVKPGQKVTVELENEGNATHTFTSPALDVNEEIDPGAKATVEVTVPANGRADFFCRFHRSQGMQGAFFGG